MTPPTETVEVHAIPTKCGTQPSVPADAYLHTTLLEVFAPNATLTPKSTIRKPNAATALKDIKKCQDKDAMESAPPSAVPIKIGSEEDVFASLATS